MWVTIFAPLMVRGDAPSVGTEVQLLSRQLESLASVEPPQDSSMIHR